MNNFVFSNDPVLYTPPISQQAYLGQGDNDIRQKLDNAFAQYHEMQKQFNERQNQLNRVQPKDNLGELDTMMKELDDDVVNRLSNNSEYLALNAELQSMIQTEIMSSVKWKINENPNAISKIDKMKSLISEIKKELSLEEKRNMMELNDYLKNYSDMTFDDYKKLKEITNES